MSFVRWLVLVAVFFTAFMGCLVPAHASTGYVVRCGTHLCLNGSTYRFDGFNMYYLNSVSNCGPVYTASQVNTSLTDQAGGEAFRSWFFEHEVSATGVINWKPFDQTLAIAAAHHFKVIVTLDNEWPDCVASGKKTLAWYTSGYKVRDGDGPLSYQSWVRAVVSRYVNHPEILAWQLVNEPEAPNSNGSCSELSARNALRAFADNVGGMIHGIDHNHIVSLGSIGSGQCGMQGSDYKYVYSSPGSDLCEYHDYGSPGVPMPGDQWNGLKTRISECSSLNKPLFVGETGITESSVGSYAKRASDFDAKFRAQFGSGVVGELFWSWNIHGSNSGYDIGPADPSTALLRKY